MTITIPPYSSQTQRVICTKCLLKWCETNKLQWCQTFWLCAYIFYCNNSFIHFYGLYSESVGVCNNPAPPPFFSPCVCLQILQIFLLFSLNPCILQQKNQWNCITICPENLSTCKYWIQPQNNCDKKRKCFFSVSFNGTISNFPLICYSFQIEATFDIFGYTNFMLVLISISF